MASSRGRELDSKQIHEQLHDDSDPSCEFIHDSDIDVFERIGPDLSDSCSNSDHGQVSGNVGGDYVGGGGYTMKTIVKMGFYGTKITVISIYHFMRHLVINRFEADKCLFLQTNFYAIF
jgi:hypothetical protein